MMNYMKSRTIVPPKEKGFNIPRLACPKKNNEITTKEKTKSKSQKEKRK